MKLTLTSFRVMVCLIAWSAALNADESAYRTWNLKTGESILGARKLVGVEGSKVRLERQYDGQVEAFEISGLGDDELRLIELWKDPHKRSAIQRAWELGNLEIAADNRISLRLSNWEAKDEDLQLIIKAFPKVTSLAIGNSRFTPEGLKAIVELKELRKLELDVVLREEERGMRDSVVDPGFSTIARVKSLEELELRGTNGQSFGKHYEDLVGTQLKRLTLHFVHLPTTDVQRIAKIESLEYLSPGISHTKGIEAPFLSHLRALKRLRGLRLEFPLTDEDADQLPGFPELRELRISGWTSYGIAELAKCDQLEELTILDHTNTPTTNADLENIAKLRKLKTLWLRSGEITDAGLAHLAGMTQLEEFHLPPAITPKGLRHLEKLTKLKRLDFPRYFEVDDRKLLLNLSDGFDLLVNRQGRQPREALRILGYDHFDNFRNFKTLGQNLPPVDLPAMQKYAASFDDLEYYSVNEESLDEWMAAITPLNRMRYFVIEGTREDFKGILKRVPVKRSQLEHISHWNRLEQLDLDRCDFQPDALQAIVGLPRLETLELVNCEFTPGNLKAISEMRQLRSLTIFGSELRPEEIAGLGKLVNLEELIVSFPLDAKALAELKGLKKLKRLEFRREGILLGDVLRLLTNDWGRSRREAAKMILQIHENGSEVTSLSFDYVDPGPIMRLGTSSDNGEFLVKDADLAFLGDFPELYGLTIPSGIGEEGMRHVGGLKDLHALTFQGLLQKGSKLSDRGARHLQSLSKLQHLNLGESELTSTGVQSLAKLTKLKSLRMEKSRLNDEALEHLREFKDLQELAFNGTNITHKGLDHLKDLPKLERIDLGSLDDEKQEAIRRAYPKRGFNGLIPFGQQQD